MNKSGLEQKLQQFVDPNVDLWPSISAQITASPYSKHQQSFLLSRIFASMNRPRIMRPTLLIVTLVLMLGVSPNISTVQAMVKQALQRYGLVLVGPRTTEPIVANPTSISTQFEPISLVSLSDAQKQVPFAIPVPTWLPEGLALRGARVVTGPPIWVQLSYAASPAAEGSVLGGMGIEMTHGKRTGGYVFPAASAEDVLVNGHVATFVHGAWEKNGQWNTTTNIGSLSWEAGEFTYVLQFSNLDLTREDVIRIAESMR